MWNWISKLEELRLEGQPVIAVTVTQCTGSAPREPGAKMLVLGDGTIFGSIGGGNLEQLAIADAQESLKTAGTRTVRYPLGAKTGQCCGGTVDLLFEVINTGPALYVFGAGHVGQAVCRVLAGTPFHVHLIDEREEWVFSEAAPKAVARHHCAWDEFVREAVWDNDKTHVAIMTHRHDLDQEIVADVINRSVRYIGLIGSDAKWERFKQRLSGRGVSEDRLARVRCPLGVDLGGGKAPQEIAISLAAELLREYYGREK